MKAFASGHRPLRPFLHWSDMLPMSTVADLLGFSAHPKALGFRWESLWEASEQVRAALSTAGLGGDLDVRSRPSYVPSGRLHGTVRTDVALRPEHNRAIVRKALATLPGVVYVDAGHYGAHVYRCVR